LLHAGSGERIQVPVEIAATPEARNRGLMYRNQLPGMLFVFPRSDNHRFWMKNTPLRLDMIFIGEDLRVVGLVESAVPFSTNPLAVDKPSKYVLEVNGGFVARHDIRVGDQVELRGIRVAER
jgi:uncharacterized membrane protein (UPF0127 family)